MEPAIGIPINDAYPSMDAPRTSDLYLTSLGLPSGIINEFKKSVTAFASRTWIIDNSGSMATADGHRIVHSASSTNVVNASRWEELADTILWHGALATELGAPTEFRLLNPPGGSVPQVSNDTPCFTGYPIL